MSWQDLVLTLGSGLFLLSLLPSLFGRHKPSVWTSGATGVVLVGFTVAYSSLGLWGAAATAALTSLVWLVLWAQAATR